MNRILLLGGPPPLSGSIRTVSDSTVPVVFSDGKRSWRFWPTGSIDHDTGLPIWRENQRPLKPWPQREKECWTNV